MGFFQKISKLFTSKKEEQARIEQEKFEVQIKTDMKVKQLDKEVAKIDKEANESFRKAEAYRAAGNKDAAMDAYQDYQFSRSLRRTVTKSLRMMKQITTMVKTGNLTNDVFTLLKTGMETSNFDPMAIQKIVAGNEQLKAAFEAVGDTMETYMDSGYDEMSAEAWFNSGSETNASVPESTTGLDEMKSEFEKIKRA